MDVVNENEETPSVLEQERNRMASNLQATAQKMTGRTASSSTTPRMPSRTVQRHSSMRSGGGLPRNGVSRTSSMRARPVAPTKSTDCMASMRGATIQRQNSSRLQPRTPSRGSVIRAHSSRAPPARRGQLDRTSSVDSTNSLRAYRRDQLSNARIEGPRGTAKTMGPGATLERNTSDNMSLVTTGDLSCFTMDSVNLRKTQLVADPIEGCYDEMDSCADHESISRASQFSEYPMSMQNAVAPPRTGVSRTPSRMGAIRVSKEVSADDNNDDNDHSDGEDSFGTMTSGLTTEFTEHDELLDSDNEDDDDDM